VNVVLKQKGIF